MLAPSISLLSEQAKSQPRANVTVGGVFVGRSGKPMAKARLILGEVVGDQQVLHAKIKLAANPPTAVADDGGRFQFTGVVPGVYTFVYQLARVTAVLPAEINIRALLAVTRSILPLMRDTEYGNTGEPLAERVWGREFTLLKGHTFYLEGADMKIWNATVRRGPQGPYLEVRKGVIWQERLDGKVPIKLEAWSY